VNAGDKLARRYSAACTDYIRMGDVLRVLLIEPPLLLARALRRGLEEEGLAVTVAPGRAEVDGAELKSACDVIILGPRPPRADDGRLIRRWRGQGLRTPILVLTAGGRGAADEPGPGGDGCLSVPFGLEELLSRVRALAQGADVPQPA
jgi:DNA-binding response OmpR family regulator